MHPETKEIAEHMKDFGLSLLARSIYSASYSEMGQPFSHALAVVHAAHGAEIVVKARIAQEHPLLLFPDPPKATVTPGLLSVTELFTHGRSHDFGDLPRILWAATGYRMRDQKAWADMGKLRNAIAHFAVPEKDLAKEALKFCFEIVEPMTEDFWKESAIPEIHYIDGSTVTDGYLREALDLYGIGIPPYLLKHFP